MKGNKSLNYWQCLANFKMFSLQRRRERYMIIYIWKIIEYHVPNVNRLITVTQNVRLGRKCVNCSSNNKKKYQQITGIGIALFNLMPKHIRNCNGNIESFKKALDEFLVKLPDEAHVLGHLPRRCKSNSLIDVVPTWNLDRGRTLNFSS